MEKTNFVKRLALGVMFVFVTATASFAGKGESGKSDMLISPYLDTDYSVVSLSNKTDKAATFKILDTEGQVIYEKRIKKEGLAQKLLDFSYVNDGDYTAVLNVNGADDLTETFSIKDHKLVVADNKTVNDETAKAFFNLVENTLVVSHISFGSNSFGISIANAYGEEIFEKDVDNNPAYSGKFDISALPNGQYTVSINSGDKEYRYDFDR